MILDTDNVFEEISDYVNLGSDAAKKTEDVIEEEALRHIGGYVVRKFHTKYPHLGNKETDSISQCQT